MEHKGGRALGQFVKGLRKQAGLSQEAFALKAKIGRNSIANIETGRRQASLDQLLSLAKALEVEPYLLLDVYRSAKKLYRKEGYYSSLIGFLDDEKVRALSKFVGMGNERRYNTEKIIDLLIQRDDFSTTRYRHERLRPPGAFKKNTRG